MSTSVRPGMRFGDLTPVEVRGLAALVRRVIAADARFTPEEKARVDRLSNDLGAGAALWSAIAESATRDQSDDAIRAAMSAVSREGARELLIQAAHAVQDGHTDVTGLVAGLRAVWSEAPDGGPYRS